MSSSLLDLRAPKQEDMLSSLILGSANEGRRQRRVERIESKESKNYQIGVKSVSSDETDRRRESWKVEREKEERSCCATIEGELPCLICLHHQDTNLLGNM